jgi:hypothetical protein
MFMTHENTFTVIRIKLSLKEGMSACMADSDVGKGWRAIGTG